MRKRRSRATRIEISEEAAAWARGEPGGKAFLYFSTIEQRAEIWRQLGADVVAKHAVDRPGTRPTKWWEYSAPEPRRRVGGVGTARPLAWLPLDRGLPVHWTEKDPHDPPSFEAEAAYLKRLGLLLPGEARRLTAEDFEPEAVGVPGAD
jgi:hypothetical protein